MRAIVMAIVAFQISLVHPVLAEDPLDSDRSITEKLPLFARNHCEEISNAAGQLFCGDPELNATVAKLNDATERRLNRIADRHLAIEENAEWIRKRNSSCGILRGQTVRFENLESVKDCLLKETEERIAILLDPNFDCLATNTPAGALICSDPSLAIAEAELNIQVLSLIAKLKGNDATNAFAEYARWIRERDRKCDLAGKDNVPLQELAPSESCLADYLSEKTAEIAAAKDDPGKIFGLRATSILPNADAVDLCTAQIHSANACQDFLRVNRVFEIDSEVAEQSALVTAEIEMVVLSPFAVCSPVASACTGGCWDLKSGKISQSPESRDSRDSFPVSHRMKIEKSFAFQKTASGWRCNSTALQPIDQGIAFIGP